MAFENATIHTMAGPALDNATLVVEGGKIVAVGTDVAVPGDAERRDASGMVIMPGIVDTHSHIGSVAGADRSSPIQPKCARWIRSIPAMPASPRPAPEGSRRPTSCPARAGW